jgi:maltooligosyltrehalose trehalohydrolase
MATLSDVSITSTNTRSVGANLSAEGVHYRVWAPDHVNMRVIVQSADSSERSVTLTRNEEFFEGLDEQGVAGDRYWFQLPNGERVPDVASRFQPQGVHGPSEVIDPTAYSWKTPFWHRPALRDLSIYEIHIGTFSPEGTFRGAIEKLDHLVALGVGAIQLMPVNDFPGRFNWGYDGAGLFATTRNYGRPDDLRTLVDAAHSRGIAVILDVVYNHVGPEGCYLSRFTPKYFHEGNKNTWGTGFNFDEPGSDAVREFILQNVAYWLDEFRVDGLRADATHAIADKSERHILADISHVVHTRGGFIIAEDERNPVELLHATDDTGHGFDAVWSDDFHHSVRVALTGTQEAYFSSYEGSAQELARTLRCGWTYCGQPFPFWQGRKRGSECTHLPPSSFVVCIDNHDQTGNRAHGERLAHLIEPDAYRAASALLCLSPYTPMFFMGQEWAASTPFLFFSDLSDEIGRNVRKGRIAEFEKIGLNQDKEKLKTMPEPQSLATFAASHLEWSELTEPAHERIFLLYQECLRWRRAHLPGAASDRALWNVVAIPEGVAIRFSPPDQPQWLLIVSLKGGAPVIFTHDLAPPGDSHWLTVFHTLESRFGGTSETIVNPRYFRDETLALLAPVTLVLQASHAS